nr:hypothetical protein RSP673_05875 [Ralstonia solanacearum P673]
MVTLLAIIGAFGVVFLQNRLESNRVEAVARKDRIRKRYRASTYAEALIGNSVEAAIEIVTGVEELAERTRTMAGLKLEAARIDDCAGALAQAMHQELPTEITRCVHAAWAAVQKLSRAVHRLAHVDEMRTDLLLAYCRERLEEQQAALKTVRESREKWETALATI